MGEELYMGGRETKWGVAIADDIMGLMSKVNTIRLQTVGMNLFMEVQWRNCSISPYGRCRKNTLQFAEDGVNFEIKSDN